MKRFFILISCYLSTTLLPDLSGQSVISDQDFAGQASTLIEELVLFTDRSIYAVDEAILFKASYFTNTDMGDIEWSTVLYLELIKPDGTALVQKKYPLTKNGADGRLHIPENLLTGVYYLKAYTKWMRNFPVQDYAYCKLKLINPKAELVETSETINNSNEQAIFDTPKKNTNVHLNTNKIKYGHREKVTIILQSDEPSEDENSYSIAVVRNGAKAISGTYPIRNKKLAATNNTIKFYPEIRGVTLSGKVFNKQTQQAAENAMVYLSLLNGHAYFSGYKTTDEGAFFFSIPKFSNVHDFFITAEKDSLALNIELDEDFCAREVFLPLEAFKLSEAERSLAKALCINTQISKAYAEPPAVKAASESNKAYSFNARGKRKIYTKDYIELPNLEEFIFELVPEMFVSYKKNEQAIRTSILNSLSNHPVLLMLDNIPISDPELFLKIDTDKIEYIEVIASGYVIGDMKYSGIVNAFSKEGDIAGIDLPDNSSFFSYSLLSGMTESYSDDENIEALPKRIPDRRNCLFWAPDFQMGSRSEKSFSFYTSDLKGEYQVLVQITSGKSGAVSYVKQKFVVE